MWRWGPVGRDSGATPLAGGAAPLEGSLELDASAQPRCGQSSYLGARLRDERGIVGNVAVDAGRNVVVTGEVRDRHHLYARPAPDGRVFFLTGSGADLEYAGRSFTAPLGCRKLLVGSFDAEGHVSFVQELAPSPFESFQAGIGVDAEHHPVILSIADGDPSSSTAEIVVTKIATGEAP